VRQGDLGHQGLRPVATRHAKDVRSALHSSLGTPLEIVAGAEDDILDPSSVGLVGQGNPLGGPPPDLGFANSTGWVLGPTRAPGMRAAGGRWTAARTARLAPSAATASRRTTTTADAGSPVSRRSGG
jgi:hypothetical protein